MTPPHFVSATSTIGVMVLHLLTFLCSLFYLSLLLQHSLVGYIPVCNILRLALFQ